MYFHACARSKIQITAPPDQLSFFAATNEKGRSHFPYIWISQIFSQIIFSLFAPPINSMTTLYHKGERINANFTGARPPPSLTSSSFSGLSTRSPLSTLKLLFADRSGQSKKLHSARLFVKKIIDYNQ